MYCSNGETSKSVNWKVWNWLNHVNHGEVRGFESEVSSCRRMWLFIINESIEDYINENPKYYYRLGRTEAQIAEAFLFSDFCREICEMIDISYSALIKVTKEYKSGKRQKRYLTEMALDRKAIRKFKLKIGGKNEIEEALSIITSELRSTAA